MKHLVTRENKVFEIVLDNPGLLLMMEHMGLRLEFHEKTVEQICAENSIDVTLLLLLSNIYNGHLPDERSSVSFEHTGPLIDYLKNAHQYYLNEKYPEIKDYIETICMLNNTPEIAMLRTFFEEYFGEVMEHLRYENEVVFPYMESLINHMNCRSEKDEEPEYSVTDYKEHHTDIEEKLADLKNLLIKYLPVGTDHIVRRKLLLELAGLEHDLNIHSKIEDIILIPLVERLERIVRKNI